MMMLLCRFARREGWSFDDIIIIIDGLALAE
jgi:hypothetical protein